MGILEEIHYKQQYKAMLEFERENHKQTIVERDQALEILAKVQGWTIKDAMNHVRTVVERGGTETCPDANPDLYKPDRYTGRLKRKDYGP